MLFQATPPDTSGYMIAGYTIFSLVLAIYLLSLFIRTRNLNQDMLTLNSVKEDRRPTASTKTKARRIGAGKSQKVRKKVTKKK